MKVRVPRSKPFKQTGTAGFGQLPMAKPFKQTGSAGLGPKPVGPTAFKPSSAPPPPPRVGNKPTALPVDPAYDQQVGAIDRRTTQNVAGLTAQRDARLLDEGYTATYDDQGVATNLAFDPTNVFSRAAQLRKRYMESRRGTQNGMAAGRQLYSGALQTAQREVDYNESQATDEQLKGLQAFLARNRSDIGGAYTQREFDLGDATAGRLERAPTNPLYSAATPAQLRGGATYSQPATQGGGVGHVDKPGKDSKGRQGIWRLYNDGRKVFIAKGKA